MFYLFRCLKHLILNFKIFCYFGMFLFLAWGKNQFSFQSEHFINLPKIIYFKVIKLELESKWDFIQNNLISFIIQKAHNCEIYFPLFTVSLTLWSLVHNLKEEFLNYSWGPGIFLSSRMTTGGKRLNYYLNEFFFFILLLSIFSNSLSF